MVAPAGPREERFQELERVEQLKDSENVPVHLFTDVYEASTMCQEYDPGAGAQLSRAVLSLPSSSRETRLSKSMENILFHSVAWGSASLCLAKPSQ